MLRRLMSLRGSRGSQQVALDESDGDAEVGKTLMDDIGPPAEDSDLDSTTGQAKASASPPPPLPVSDPLAARLSNDVIARCARWVKESWATPATPIVEVHVNPGVLHGAPSFQRFKQALLKERLETAEDDSFLFGWHGTAESSVPLICHYGFDVELRRGQQYGIGEYFGWSNGTSMGYCRDGCLLLVCLIAKGAWTSQQPGTALIVRNPPSSEGISYCLPLLVVNFGQKKPLIFMSTEAQQGQFGFKYGKNS